MVDEWVRPNPQRQCSTRDGREMMSDFCRWWGQILPEAWKSHWFISVHFFCVLSKTCSTFLPVIIDLYFSGRLRRNCDLIKQCAWEMCGIFSRRVPLLFLNGDFRGTLFLDYYQRPQIKDELVHYERSLKWNVGGTDCIFLTFCAWTPSLISFLLYTLCEPFIRNNFVIRSVCFMRLTSLYRWKDRLNILVRDI